MLLSLSITLSHNSTLNLAIDPSFGTIFHHLVAGLGGVELSFRTTVNSVVEPFQAIAAFARKTTHPVTDHQVLRSVAYSNSGNAGVLTSSQVRPVQSHT